MRERIERGLTRLWLAFTVPPVLALAIQLGTTLGTHPWPALAAAPLQAADAVHRRNGTSVGLDRRGEAPAIIP